MKSQTKLKLLTILIPIIVLLIYLVHDSIFHYLSQLPTCPFYSLFDLYCPACGNTRSVKALINGDILSSLRYNVEPMILIILSTLLYIELVTKSFGKHIRLLPRKFSFYLTLIILLVLYLIVRNFFPYLTPPISVS